MGSAIAQAIIKNLSPEPKLTISDPNPEKLADLAEQRAKITSDNLAAIKSADYIIIATKPQQIEKLSSQIKSKIPKNALLVSICAGTTIEHLQKAFDHPAVVRAMPNTPAQIGAGITGWYASTEVTPAHRFDISQVFATFGEEIQVDSEDLIDAVTAVSGSGPAYFFYFLENIIAGGISCGLSEEKATKLAIQTALGASKLAIKEFNSKPYLTGTTLSAARLSPSEKIADLRRKVTSPGGTTEAAIKHLESKHTGPQICEAVKKAYERAKEL